ncbi:conserved hypothetical protein [Paraburkholderia caribensis]|nr:conserved hypothetical protein [Paraburkholderia caribensis]
MMYGLALAFVNSIKGGRAEELLLGKVRKRPQGPILARPARIVSKASQYPQLRVAREMKNTKCIRARLSRA